MSRLIIILWFFSGLIRMLYFTWLQWPNNNYEVIFCDVGQGDGAIVKHGNYQIVVDAGNNDGKMANCLDRYLPWWDNLIELLVISHPDLDHVGGMESLIMRYKIERLIYKPLPIKKDEILALDALLQEKIGHSITNIILPFNGYSPPSPQGISTKVLFSGFHDIPSPYKKVIKEITTEEELWDLYQQKDKISSELRINTNNESIVLFLQIKNKNILFTGDLEQEGEKALISMGLLPQVDVLKVAHHGSNSSSSLAFIKKIQPELSIVSSGQNNSYGHPHREVVSRLEKEGSRLLRTDQLGTIILNISTSTTN